MTVRLAPLAAVRKLLASVALGRRPADLVVTGGALVDVFTEEVLEGWGVAVAEGRVAYVGPDAGSMVGDATEVVDAAGDLVWPGLFEAHTHLPRTGLPELARLQVAAGVTTTVLETVEVATVCGPVGFRALLAQAAAAPGRTLLTVPPVIGIDPVHEARVAAAERWIELLDEPGVIGVGELYWADLLRGHRRSEALIDAAIERDLAVEGHGAGAREAALNALTATGWGDDHEAIDAAGTITRLRLGLHALARHGATRQDLDAIAEAWRDRDLGGARLSLSTDGVEPDRLSRGSSLNSLVERAVAGGMPLARAVRMASRTPAERFGLGRWLGGLGPGMLADVAIVPRGGFNPRLVLTAGRAPAGGTLVELPPRLFDTVRIGDPGDDLFEPPGKGAWRAMELVAPLVTREAGTTGEGALTVVAADRLEPGRAFKGLLLGFGLRAGGVALTTGWDTPSMVIAGDSPSDMKLAAERVEKIRGGVAVVASGRVAAEWAAPLGGVVSLAPASQVAREIAVVNEALAALGCRLPSPLLTLETLTSPAIPHLRITAGGYVRLRDGSRCGLSW